MNLLLYFKLFNYQYFNFVSRKAFTNEGNSYLFL